MNPIPKKLLIHSADLSNVTVGDYNTEELVDTVHLVNVRVESCDSAVTAKDNRTQTASYTLFYDCVNSFPHDVTFGMDQRVSFDGEMFHIKEAKKYFDESKLHHWEVLLCR